MYRGTGKAEYSKLADNVAANQSSDLETLRMTLRRRLYPTVYIPPYNLRFSHRLQHHGQAG